MRALPVARSAAPAAELRAGWEGLRPKGHDSPLLPCPSFCCGKKKKKKSREGKEIKNKGAKKRTVANRFENSRETSPEQ